jgi:hypothetical protein
MDNTIQILPGDPGKALESRYETPERSAYYASVNLDLSVNALPLSRWVRIHFEDFIFVIGFSRRIALNRSGRCSSRTDFQGPIIFLGGTGSP